MIKENLIKLSREQLIIIINELKSKILNPRIIEQTVALKCYTNSLKNIDENGNLKVRLTPQVLLLKETFDNIINSSMSDELSREAINNYLIEGNWEDKKFEPYIDEIFLKNNTKERD